MDGFNLLFRRVVFNALSRRRLFGAFFPGLPPCTFCQGIVQWAPSRWPFRQVLSRGTYALHIFAKESSISSFVGLFPNAFSQCLFPCAFALSFIRALCYKGFLRALFRRNFLSTLFCGGIFRALFPKCFFREFFCGGIFSFFEGMF